MAELDEVVDRLLDAVAVIARRPPACHPRPGGSAAPAAAPASVNRWSCSVATAEIQPSTCRRRSAWTTDRARTWSLSVLAISAVKPAGGQRVLDAAHHRREQRVGQVRQDHADGQRAARLQAAGDRVRRVAHLARGLGDARRGLRADQVARALVERPRRRRRMDPDAPARHHGGSSDRCPTVDPRRAPSRHHRTYG